MAWQKSWVSSCNIAIQRAKKPLQEANQSSPYPQPTPLSKRNLPHSNGSARSHRLLVPLQIGPIISSLSPTGLAAIMGLGSSVTWSQVSGIFHFGSELSIDNGSAGITVGCVVVPQSMAYAKLADLPVQYGLYSSFMGVLIYWFFATSKDITIGVSKARRLPLCCFADP